jgi:hypothetical protein
VQVLDKLLSKYHCCISYSPKEGWTLFDGKENQNPSTNGTWYIISKHRLFLNEDFEVYDKLVFKSNQTVFQVSMFNIVFYESNSSRMMD